MKIKELHLRNIASIEKADIDFERDLVDGETGALASTFLISGDTGSGKSIILDGISMALYKKTPRLSSVSNQRNNSFVASTGETVNIINIQQYTRLGISPKDECYSELVFEGNDGVEYKARLTLGMYLGNTDATTKKRSLKYKNPSWSLTFLDHIITSEADIRAVITEAVGLSFEQFGRMAMLAQGQFASFLIGDKKEREAILEQLTNTSHFTDFGNALKSLCDKYKDECVQAEREFDLQSSHSLSPENLEQLNREKDECEKTRKSLDEKIRSVQKSIRGVTLIGSAKEALAEAQNKKIQLEEKMGSQEYKEKVSLAEDWKATVDQRRWLSEMRKATNDKKKEKEKEDSLRDSFFQLTADLCYKKGEANKKAEEIRRLQAWMDDCQSRAELYTDASAICVKIDNLIRTGKELENTTQKSAIEAGKTDALQKALAEAKAAVVVADSAVVDKQKRIDDLTGQRKSLEPEETSRKIAKANENKTRLSEMKTKSGLIKSASQQAQALEKQISEDSSELVRLEEKQKEAQKCYTDASDIYETARNAFATMKMSLDEKIVGLRKKLQKDHTDTCPLCGQHITKLCLEEEFEDFLNPLEDKEKEAKEEFDKAKKALEEASSNYNTVSGALMVKKESHAKEVAKIENQKNALNAKATEMGLEANEDLDGQIEKALCKLESELSELTALQNQALELQRQIDILLNEKRTFDIKKSEEDKKKNEAQRQVDSNVAEVKRLSETVTGLSTNFEGLRKEIALVMDETYPDWDKDAAGARERLKKDAKEYADKKKLLSDAQVSLNDQQHKIEHVEGHCRRVRSRHGDWEMSSLSQKHGNTSIQDDWSNLVSEVEITATRMKDLDSAISEKFTALNSYYQNSGKTEEVLDAIEARSGEIEGIGEMVRQTKADLQSSADAIAAANAKIAELKVQLQVESDEAIPVLEDLNNEEKKLSAEKDLVIGRLSGIITQLEADSLNKDLVAKAKEKMVLAREVSQKWEKLNKLFGGTRFRTLVQSYILRPLLNNANIYLRRITDRYTLTCLDDNEQLSIFVRDGYNKNEVRSVAVLSGGERFMISLALALALSSLNRPDMNVNILFIDEGFGTLDGKTLDSVMQTLERLQEIAGEGNRRVGIISHREELDERIPVQVQVIKQGEGRSIVKVKN